MKKLLLLAAIGLLPCLASAQTTPRDTAITTKNSNAVEYCSVSFYKYKGKQILAIADYGRNQTVKEEIITDRNGNPILFNSMVDVFNYQGLQGWQLITATYVNENTSYFVMKRPRVN